MSKKKSDLMFKKGGPISKVPVSFVASGQLSTVDAPETSQESSAAGHVQDQPDQDAPQEDDGLVVLDTCKFLLNLYTINNDITNTVKPRFKRVKVPDGLFLFYKTSI